MFRLQFYRNIQKKSTNPSIRTLVSTLQCRFLCVFRILPYTHSAKMPAVLLPWLPSGRLCTKNGCGLFKVFLVYFFFFFRYSVGFGRAAAHRF